MSGSIHFDGDYTSSGLEHRLAQALRQGQLPGKFGLLQELVGHWAFPKDERSWLRAGKAALDSLGSVLAHRESSREIVEGEGSPSTRWLRKGGYTFELSGMSRGLGSFLRGTLDGVDFRERRVRTEVGELDRGVLKEFEIGSGRVAFLLNPWGGDPAGARGTRTQSWLGPYCRPDDAELLRAFLRERIWKDCLQSSTLLFDVSEPTSALGEDAVRLSAVSDRFDFASCNEAFNDVEALARRCGAFLIGGRSRRLLLHGPPGTGKSTLARALARQLGARAVLMAHEATSRLADATVIRILALLEPGVVVLNDVDRSGAEDALSLLHGLEALVEHPMIAILTANDVSTLDPALLRPGRVDEIREVPEPNRESRAVIVDHYAERYGLDLRGAVREIALDRTEGFSPADIREFAETARAVGLDLALEELERIAAQRELYAGDRCEAYNQGQRGGAWRRRA